MCVFGFPFSSAGAVSSALSLAYVSDLGPRALVRLQVREDALGVLEDGTDLVPYLPLSLRGLGI